MNNKDVFLQVIKDEFAPRLRNIGFKGSGHNFKRINNEIINIINIQANKYGGSYAVNLGLHLTFLPISWSIELPDIKKIKVADCEFTMRLAPKNKNDYWWKYNGVLCNPSKNAHHLINTYFKYGENNFEEFKTIDDFITTYTIDKVKKDNYSNNFRGKSVQRGALTMARIYNYLGQIDNAKKFARVGMDNIGNATTLRPEFEKILNR